MESGNRKTAVLRAMARPFVDWALTEQERLQPERKRLLSERKTAEGQIEALRKNAAEWLADPRLVAQITARAAGLLYGLPVSPLGSRLLHPNPVPPEVADAYRAGVQRLLALPIPTPGTDGKLSTWQLEFSPDAYRSWKDFSVQLNCLCGRVASC